MKKADLKPLIIIAPDKFKGTLSSGKAARVIKEAIASLGIGARMRIVEMADGGEGTARLLAGKGGRRVFFDALDCRNSRIRAAVWVDESTSSAYLDCAEVIGMKRRSNLRVGPMSRSTFGLGILLKTLIDRYEAVGLCVGGTATVDCGIGMMQGLGARFYSSDTLMADGITSADFLGDVERVDWSGVDAEKLRLKLTVYADVDVALIAPEGTASSLMFARQKGVTDMRQLATFISRYEQTLPGRHGFLSGAGGGVASALGAMGVKIVSGADALLPRIESIISGNRPALLVTGEGSVDAQSFEGKVVGKLYELCRAHEIPMLAIGGIADSTLPARPGLEVIATTARRGEFITEAQAADNLLITTKMAIKNYF